MWVFLKKSYGLIREIFEGFLEEVVFGSNLKEREGYE